jgi:hypothetical protein
MSVAVHPRTCWVEAPEAHSELKAVIPTAGAAIAAALVTASTHKYALDLQERGLLAISGTFMPYHNISNLSQRSLKLSMPFTHVLSCHLPPACSPFPRRCSPYAAFPTWLPASTSRPKPWHQRRHAQGLSACANCRVQMWVRGRCMVGGHKTERPFK